MKQRNSDFAHARSAGALRSRKHVSKKLKTGRKAKHKKGKEP